MNLKEIKTINDLLNSDDISDELFEKIKQLQSKEDVLQEIKELNNLKNLFNLIENNKIYDEFNKLSNMEYINKLQNEKILKLEYKITKYEDMIRGFIDG